MPYFPGIPPEALDDWRRWLEDELERINPNVISGQEHMGFKVHYEEPNKYEIGQIVFASGYYNPTGSPMLGSPLGSPVVGWDPGAGQGMYEYTVLGWQKLGAGTGGYVPTDHGVLQGLSDDDHPQYHNDTRGDARYYTRAILDAWTLSALNDCTITLPSTGQILEYDGAEWVNVTPADPAYELDDLSDVTLGSPPTDRDIMIYDTVSGQWQNEQIPTTVLGTSQMDGGTAATAYMLYQNGEGGGSATLYFTSDIADGGSA